MSIYISGMEMPKTNLGSVLIIYPDGKVYCNGWMDYTAIPVLEHGRLGDLDELLDRAFGCLDEESFLAFQFLVNGSVTIIPSDKEETT